MTRTTDRLARVAAAVDRAFGEEALVLRFTSVGQMKTAKPDPTRAPLTIQTKFFAASAIEKPDATKSGRKHFVSDLSGVADRATVSLDAFASSDDWPQRGDRLQRLELPGQPVLEVLMAAPDAAGRLTILLGRVGAKSTPPTSTTGS